MKHLIRKLVPKGWLTVYRKVRYANLPRVYKPCVSSTSHILKGQYHGQRCFIVGNAPSLAHTNVSLLKNEHTLLVNRGFLLKDRGLNSCTFYGISDKNAYTEYGQDVPSDFAKHVCIFGSIPWGKKIQNLTAFAMFGENNRSKHMSAGFFQFNVSKPVAHSYNVVLQMLQVAVYAGFTEIYIIGVDNDFSGKNMHFYKDSAQERKNMDVWGINPCADNEKAFAAAYQILKKQGILLANAGVNGALNALPRVQLESLFND